MRLILMSLLRGIGYGTFQADDNRSALDLSVHALLLCYPFANSTFITRSLEETNMELAKGAGFAPAS
jgi:hypothetical protein